MRHPLLVRCCLAGYLEQQCTGNMPCLLRSSMPSSRQSRQPVVRHADCLYLAAAVYGMAGSLSGIGRTVRLAWHRCLMQQVQ